MSAKFEKAINYDLDKNQLMEKAIITLEKCTFKIENIDKRSGVIQAKSNFSIYSWSEKIDVKVEDNGTVTMKSECSWPLQIFAWGKNKRNVLEFFRNLG